MQFALALVIVLLATTAQAGLLPNVPLVGGVANQVADTTKDVPVVGSVANNLGEILPTGDLPVDDLTSVLPDLPIPNVEGLTEILKNLLAVVQKTLETLLSGINVPDVGNIANVGDLANVGDVANAL